VRSEARITLNFTHGSGEVPMNSLNVRILFLFVLAVMLASGMSLAQTISRASSDEPSPGALAPVLNANGTLNLQAARGGSFNARGWMMISGHDQQPRFLPQQIQDTTGNMYWSDRFGTPGFPLGRIYCVAVAPNGDIYAGGYFTNAGGTSAIYLAKWNGSEWGPVGGGCAGGGSGGAVYAIAFNGSNVYVAGQYSTVDTGSAAMSVGNIAMWNGSTWSDMGGGTGIGTYIHALAYFNGKLYAGGYFSQISGVNANNIATWNGSTWSPVGGGVTLGPSGGFSPVSSIVPIGSDLYVGGNFTNADNIVANNVAKLVGGTQWQQLYDGVRKLIGTGIYGAVSCMATDGSNLYVAGAFQLLPNFDTVNNIMKWTGSTWATLGKGLEPGHYGVTDVFGIAALGTDIYAAGIFDFAGGNPAHQVARWNGTRWDSLSTGADVDGQCYAVSSIGGNIYVGGSFSQLGRRTVFGLGRWDGTSWNPLGGGLAIDALSAPTVSALSFDGANNLYVAGTFQSAQGRTVNGVARFNGTTWDSLSASECPTVGSVKAIAVSGTTVYIGGTFSQVGSVAAHNIAKWDGAHWSAVGSGTEGTDFQVNSIVASGGNVFVGGTFTKAGGMTVNHVALWNGSSWSALGAGVDGWVNAMAVNGTDLYVGGAFGQAGSTPANYVARWNGSTWSALGSGLGYFPYAMAFSGTNLYVGGVFTTAGGAAANGIARWDGSNWFNLGGGVTNPGNAYGTNVYSIVCQGSNVYVGGIFQKAGNISASNIALWDGSTWQSMGDGVGAAVSYVYAMGRNNAGLYVGGAFGTAGSKPVGGLTVWTKGVSTAVETRDRLPGAFELMQNYPNPFNPTTVVRYQLPGASNVRLVVFDLLGREVSTLVNERQGPGSYEVKFNASGLASGVYLYRLTAESFTQSRAMLLLK
jgi:trimeric autotransporter adhesin